MECPRCLNRDPSYFYHGKSGTYCRKCISFGRAMLEEENDVSLVPIQEGSEEYELKYPLTKAQYQISKTCAKEIEKGDVLLHCVCGAGKTEIVVESIASALRQRKKVCFAIPRRQVVLELRYRLASYFPFAKVVAVCGGYTDDIDGDLIICTTHQLYRYYKTFDLLILDEPDAFPFRGNEVLHGIAKTSCKGRRIYMTATLDDELKKEVKEGKLKKLSLQVRPHEKPLPMPKEIRLPKIFLWIALIDFLKDNPNKPKMVFVPTIQMAKIMYFVLKIFFVDCDYCTSQNKNRDEVIFAFRNKKRGILICTTVLERGITIENVDICVYLANHSVFDEASLTQMAGRAGRSFHYPFGEVLFLSNQKSDLVEKCKQEIAEANHALLNL